MASAQPTVSTPLTATTLAARGTPVVHSRVIPGSPGTGYRYTAGSATPQVIAASRAGLTTATGSTINLQGVRRVTHLNGATDESPLRGPVIPRHAPLAEGAEVVHTSSAAAHVVHTSSPLVVSGYHTLPTQYVEQKESGWRKLTGELVDEKVYEGRKLQAELVDEKIYEGRKLVGELIDEKVTMGKAAATTVVEEVVRPVPLVQQNLRELPPTVRELPAVVRSVNTLDPVYVRGAASEVTNTYVNVGQPIVHEYPAVTITDSAPVFINGKAYRRTTGGFTPLSNTLGNYHTVSSAHQLPVASSLTSSLPRGYVAHQPTRVLSSPGFASPAYRLQPVIRDDISVDGFVRKAL